MDDLFFTVKVSDAAKKVGLTCVFVKTPEALLARLAERPLLVVLDLNYAGIDPVKIITDIKRGEHRDISLVGFVSHVQTDLRQQAQEAGCDLVVARSVFSSSLPEILRRHAGLPT
jgi:CheY-like chemotaxis protein